MDVTPLATLALTVLSALGGARQDDAVPPPDAMSVLDRAARFQRGGTPLPPPMAFRVQFYVQVAQEGGTFPVDVERVYARGPERMVTTRRDSVVNTDSTVGWDGRTAWFRDNHSGEVVVYSEDPEAFFTDLEDLDFQLDLTALILDAVALDALSQRLEAPTVAGTEEVVDLDGREHLADVVRAEVVDTLFGPDPDAPPPGPDDPEPRLEVELAVDRETGAVWRVAVATLDRAAPRSVSLAFDFHSPNRDGVIVPGNIRVYEDGRGGDDWTAKLGVAQDGDAFDAPVLFELDPPLAEVDFAVPGRDEG